MSTEALYHIFYKGRKPEVPTICGQVFSDILQTKENFRSSSSTRQLGQIFFWHLLPTQLKSSLTCIGFKPAFQIVYSPFTEKKLQCCSSILTSGLQRDVLLQHGRRCPEDVEEGFSVYHSRTRFFCSAHKHIFLSY